MVEHSLPPGIIKPLQRRIGENFDSTWQNFNLVPEASASAAALRVRVWTGFYDGFWFGRESSDIRPGDLQNEHQNIP
jgi:hypothetical protein